MARPFFLIDELAPTATATASRPALAGTSAANVVKHEPALVYRCAESSALSSVDFVIDAGRLIAWDTIAILGSNQRGGDFIKVMADPTNSSIPETQGTLVIDSVPNVKSPASPTPMKIVKTIATTRNDRYFRVRLTVGPTALPEGYSQCGTIIIGRRFSFNFDMDVSACCGLQPFLVLLEH